MGKTWHKPEYLKSDLDPITFEPLPGIMHPGIYCEDEATLDQIIKDPRVGKVERAYFAPREEGRPRAWPPISVAGIRVRVANEVELAILRGVKAKAPEPAVDPMAEISDKVKALMETIRAREHARGQAMGGEVIRPDGRGEPLISDGRDRDRVTPHPLRIPTQMNRAARRSAASRRS